MRRRTWGDAGWIGGLCVLALALRLGVAVLFPGPVHPDETFQYVEQAYRLVHGVGVVPWEYVDGVRSWLIPLVLAGVELVAERLGPAPGSFLAGVVVTMSLLSLPGVVCGFLWGRRVSGLAAGIVAGALNAVWFEAVYFSVHPLADSFAASLLVPGLFLCTGAGSGRRFLAAGMLLGTAVAVRLQLAPAVGLAALLACRGRSSVAWCAIAAGGLGVVLLAGMLDWVTWSYPFSSDVAYVRNNLFGDAAAGFGAEPWYDFVAFELYVTYGLAMGLACAALVGARRLAVVGLCAVAIVASFSAVGHKEERFILPAIVLVLPLAGIGTVDLVRAALRRLAFGAVAEWRLGLGCACVWAVLSAGLAVSPRFGWQWMRGDTMVRAMRVVDADGSACGLGIYPAKRWWSSGGASHLRADIGLYGAGDGADTTARSASFDYVMALESSAGVRLARPFVVAGYGKVKCWTDRGNGRVWETVCLWRRPGGCVAGDGLLTSRSVWFGTGVTP